MRFAGSIRKVGSHWAVEVPELGIHTQGTTKTDALAMAREALEIVADRKGFKATAHLGEGEYFEIGGNDTAALVALMLRQRRSSSGLSLADVAKRLGARSRNAYARYERGVSVPTIEKLVELLLAIDPTRDVLLGPSKA